MCILRVQIDPDKEQIFKMINNSDSQKKVEVIARERIQNFMLALGNLIITPQKN